MPRPVADDSQPLPLSVRRTISLLIPSVLLFCSAAPLRAPVLVASFRRRLHTVVYSVLYSFVFSQEQQRLRALLTILPVESGLDAQSFRCHRCKSPLEIHTGMNEALVPTKSSSSH